jgi:hypothetical protein
MQVNLRARHGAEVFGHTATGTARALVERRNEGIVRPERDMGHLVFLHFCHPTMCAALVAQQYAQVKDFRRFLSNKKRTRELGQGAPEPEAL